MCMWGWGWGSEGGWGLWGIAGLAVFWLVFLAVMVLLVRSIARTAGPAPSRQAGGRELDELTKRYASGEISRDEFWRLRRELQL
ncbi:MAG: SHOCT domain-containing protein [Myxococcales bacterium]|jgi:putative membrane protein